MVPLDVEYRYDDSPDHRWEAAKLLGFAHTGVTAVGILSTGRSLFSKRIDLIRLPQAVSTDDS